jgi:hypothetical protein
LTITNGVVPHGKRDRQLLVLLRVIAPAAVVLEPELLSVEEATRGADRRRVLVAGEHQRFRAALEQLLDERAPLVEKHEAGESPAHDDERDDRHHERRGEDGELRFGEFPELGVHRAPAHSGCAHTNPA